MNDGEYYESIKKQSQDFIFRWDGANLQPNLRNLVFQFDGIEDIVFTREEIICLLRNFKFGLILDQNDKKYD